MIFHRRVVQQPRQPPRLYLSLQMPPAPVEPRKLTRKNRTPTALKRRRQGTLKIIVLKFYLLLKNPVL